MNTDGPRGIRSRVRSRTSGLSVHAITLAVRKRKRTCPSFAASRNARTSRTGRTTSWIHRGIWIVGPGPAIRWILPLRDASPWFPRRSSIRLRGHSIATIPEGARFAVACRADLSANPRRAACYGPNMATATPRSRHAARLRADRRRAQARSRRIAVGVVIAALAIATLALTAFDGETSPAVSRPAPLPVTSAPPDPQALATVGNLRIQSPVAQGGVTAVGFHASAEGALVLKPVGPQRNEGLLARLWHRITGASKTGLAWYQLSGGPLRTLDVGAVSGTDVYSPVDGTVVAIRDEIVSGKVVGSEVELRPV